MTDGRERGDREEAFFAGDASAADGPPPRRRAAAALLARNPVFAAVAILLCGWLLVDLWPDVAFFASSREPIDLGGPGAYHLERARENRLVQIRGDLAQAVPVTESRSGSPRTVGRVVGTNLVVDRPGRGGPPVYEGRLLPAGARSTYGEAVAVLRRRGAPLDDSYLVLRDGERPRHRWLSAAGAGLLVLLLAVNLRALVKNLT